MQNEREWRASNQFLCSNELVIGGTLFPNKECHKATWVSPDGRILNQINHIVISHRRKNSLQDVRVKRSRRHGSSLGHWQDKDKIGKTCKEKRLGEFVITPRSSQRAI